MWVGRVHTGLPGIYYKKVPSANPTMKAYAKCFNNIATHC